MARFSQTFLQGLLQPTYQQGLFEAARNVGQTPGIMGLEKKRKEQQAELQQLMTGDPSQIGQRVQQLRQMAVKATSSTQRQRYTAAADALEKSARTRGLQAITGKLGEMENALSDERIDTLQQEINDLAISSMQPDPTKFVGKGNNRKERVAEIMADVSEKRVDTMSNAIASSSVDIISFIDNLPSVEENPEEGFTQAEKAQLTEQSVGLREIREGRQELLDRGKLPARYTQILNNNKKLRESPDVAEALDVLAKAKDPNQTVSPGAAAKAADTIRDAVTSEYGRQLEIDRSANRLERKANNMVENLLTEGGISEWVYGEDLVEIVDRIKDEGFGVTEEMKDDFYSFIAQEIEKNPDVDRNVAIKTALDLLGEEYDIRLEEGREQNVEERQQEEADRQAAIAYLMETEDLSKKEAIRRLNTIQAERVVSQVAPMIP